MPQLLVFAPCEKVIVSGEEVGDGSSSLITILQGLNVEGPPQGPDEIVVAPITWFIFTLWKILPEDEGKSFEHLAEMFSPAGKSLLTAKTHFKVSKQFQRVASKVVGMPLAEAGDYKIALSLMEEGKQDTLKQVSVYPLTVSRITTQPTQAAPVENSKSSKNGKTKGVKT